MNRERARRIVDRFGGTTLHVAALAAAVLTSAACNSLVTEGRASSFPVIEQLLARPGNREEFSSTLASDVVTLVERDIGGQTVQVPTIFEDVARVIMRLGFKDPGIPSAPTTPTSANFITITRYHIDYRRADGRNTPGVDVPYPFDGAMTFSILDIGSGTFTIVRGQAKLDPPLRALAFNGGAIFIATIAEITFYGRDQTGSSVKVLGEMLINFSDWGD